MVGPRVLGRPLGPGCQSCGGRETPGETLLQCRASPVRFSLRTAAPDLSLPLSAFWKASVSAADSGIIGRGQVILPLQLRALLTVAGWRAKGLYKLPAPVREPAVTKHIRT